ncbi:MAG: 50S ribosomal protein L18 [bacterium]|nr:50S ribosomal protein L18 [bacterium]
MKKIIGTNKKPRISIFRSNRFISGQAVDDTRGTTISVATTRKLTGKKPTDRATEAGQKLGENLKVKKVSQVVFDRNGNKYHGNVAAFAEGVRKSGIKF